MPWITERWRGSDHFKEDPGTSEIHKRFINGTKYVIGIIENSYYTFIMMIVQSIIESREVRTETSSNRRGDL